MKQFLYTISVLLTSALLAIVIMGLFIKEVQYSTTVRVKAPIADSWITFIDLDRQSLWQQNLNHIEIIRGESMSIGTSFLMEFSDGTSRVETVTSIIPAKEYNANIETERYSGFRSVTFQALSDGSRIQQTIVMQGSSFISRAMLTILRPWMQHNQTDAFDHLTNLIEKSPSIEPQIDE